ncbi:glycosyltransferase [Aurantibacter sp.]|uniref:glycosyltransferase n=1 Tax=Aurantibacter sp. TaxID=2807103 RepID=UPI0035C86052
MKKRILVAPLNWGIGHACRCIPIINTLLKLKFNVVIASDGEALLLLQKEFPNLESTELPSYNVTYSESRKKFKTHLLKQLPKIQKVIKAEYKATQQIIIDFKIDGIISDNRLGVYSSTIYSVFVTHQLKVLSGSTTWLSSFFHNRFIKKFNECWIPDFENSPNLSGILSHFSSIKVKTPTRFIGGLSRFQPSKIKHKYAIMVLLSGPEPQRTLLEEKLLVELNKCSRPVLFVQGKIEINQKTERLKNITTINFLTSKGLEIALNESDLIICRSGYTSIMDLAKLQKKAFFIPTPGQSEQEYLAKHIETQNIAPFCNQDIFTLEQLAKVENYSGFKNLPFKEDLAEELFSCFI